MKTVSLELAKQLKEAGYPQIGHFIYRRCRRWDGKKDVDYWVLMEKFEKSRIDDYLSPTADEILERLPTSIEYLGKVCYLHIDAQFERWYVHYADEIHFTGQENENLTNLLARLWLYLKKEKLI